MADLDDAIRDATIHAQLEQQRLRRDRVDARVSIHVGTEVWEYLCSMAEKVSGFHTNTIDTIMGVPIYCHDAMPNFIEVRTTARFYTNPTP